MPATPIQPGQTIRASWLNAVAADAGRLAGFGSPPGAPGGGFAPAAAGSGTRYGAVVARSVPDDAPRFGTEIEYTVHVPGVADLRVPWNKRVVPVQADLLGPGGPADRRMLFVPAPVVGSAAANAQPWRTLVLVHVLPVIGPDGAPVWWAQVLGEAPHRGC